MSDDLQRAAERHRDVVLRRFFDEAGRLTSMPAKQSRQLAVFDLIAQKFVPGVRYTEVEVNRELIPLYDDYVTLRRGLVDYGLLDRADGEYWRIGGTVDVGVDVGDEVGDDVADPEPAPTEPAPASTADVRAPSARGAARREAILSAAATLFAERGYAAVGMDDIGAAAGVTGPAIYRHFPAKAEVLTAVFDRIIDAVTDGSDDAALGDPDPSPADALTTRIGLYAIGVAQRRELMGVFVREVHALPPEHRARLRARQRALVGRWRTLLGQAHPDWSAERVRTAVHGAFALLNAVGTFESPLSEAELAGQLTDLAIGALALQSDR